jgi:nitrogen-specific signal transduction histidine kinase/iron only hydrogenase large subunit-like protein
MDGIISTIKQNCRRCYTCVRDCPAKAIRIEDGQASVVPDRCISCGNCTMVCSQGAKAYASGVEGVLRLLEQGGEAQGGGPVAALLAPSFPVGFSTPPTQVVGALRAAGFTYVVEVAYGADLVNEACRKYLEDNPTGLHISSACPAVVEYVRKYQPALTQRIMPIVSPMVATALAVKDRFGEQVRCVFVGPCVAKKAEILDPGLAGTVDEVITLTELESVLAARGVDMAGAASGDFDPPHAGTARIYPIPGGLFESAGIGDGLADPRLIVVSGKDETVETLAGLLEGLPEDDDKGLLLVEALMCRGCYAGPGVKSKDSGVVRSRKVAEFAASRMRRQQRGMLPPYEDGNGHLDLSRSFAPNDQRTQEPTEEEIRDILAHTNKFFPEDELDCGACGYPTCRAKAAAVYAGMAEEAMCLPFIIDQAERVCHELNVPWSNLRDVHSHLINSEKLASMGQMAAGVAHELNNPLSTILLYSHILQRKLQDREDLGHDLRLMAEESARCKKIIGNLLDFARQSRVRIEPVSVEDLVNSSVDGAMASIPSGPGHDVRVVADVTPGLRADLDRDQMTQVLVNLIKNGAEAMEGRTGTIQVSACEVPDKGRIRFSVNDQGTGISVSARDKIFQPFFTTKSIGKGTGLGLPISYGIVKMHNGNIWYDTEPGVGTTFYVEIPITRKGGERSTR